jgi:phosphatidylinositol 3-kinase
LPISPTSKSKKTEQILSSFRLNYILKFGDDLRQDSSVISLFQYMNYIWKVEKVQYHRRYNVECFIYNVISMGNDFGCIEFIKDCVALRDISDYHSEFIAQPVKIERLIVSAAASYIASFILGVRDRHFDNVLIRNDGTLFHIDFGYVLGQKVFGIDTSKIAITSQLRELMSGEYWREFIDLGTQAYMKLRLHYSSITSYAQMLFQFDASCKPNKYIFKQLRMGLNNQQAEQYIRKKLKSAPTQIKTRFKNVIHNIVLKNK